MSDNDLYAWCRERGERFRVWESREMAYFPTPESRDTAIVEWVIRCLANPMFQSGNEVLDIVRKQRDSATTAAGGAEGDKSKGSSDVRMPGEGR